jgi:lysophospholipase L1-like esterase
MRKNILASLTSIIIALILTEVSLSLLFPIEDPYKKYKMKEEITNRFIESQFPPNQDYTFYPDIVLAGMPQKVKFTTNNFGFRSPYLSQPKPSDEFRIFVVGGSTTECFFLDDTNTVTHFLESHLNKAATENKKVTVYNAGKSGDHSYDHIAMISQRIIHLEPDMIIVFCGINDLTAAIYETDYTHLPRESSLTFSIIDLTKHLLTEFQLPRRLYFLYQSVFKKRSSDDVLMAINYHSNFGQVIEMRKSHPVSDTPPRTDPEPYRNNLLTIIGIAQAHDVKLMFMTQATTWNSQIDPATSDVHWMTFRNNVTFSMADMDVALESYNDVMRELAQSHNIPIFDLARRIPKSLEYFYDDCHFNVNGSRETGKWVGDFLLENQLLQ